MVHRASPFERPFWQRGVGVACAAARQPLPLALAHAAGMAALLATPPGSSHPFHWLRAGLGHRAAVGARRNARRFRARRVRCGPAVAARGATCLRAQPASPPVLASGGRLVSDRGPAKEAEATTEPCEARGWARRRSRPRAALGAARVPSMWPACASIHAAACRLPQVCRQARWAPGARPLRQDHCPHHQAELWAQPRLLRPGASASSRAQFECPARLPRPRSPPALAPAPDRPGRPPASLRPQVLVAQKVTTGVYKGVTTTELDELAAETAASMTASHPDYALVRSSWAGMGWQRPPLLHAAAVARAALRRRRRRRLPTDTTLPPRARSWRPASRCPTCTRTR